MNVKIYFLITFLCITFGSCGFLDGAKEEKEVSDAIERSNNKDVMKDNATNTQETIDDYTDTYTITPDYDSPRFKELITQFNKQEHRFEMDACEFRYNGQSFFIGDSVEKIKTIFGDPDGEVIMSLDKTMITFNYSNLGLKFRFSVKSKVLEVFLLKIRNIRENHVVPYDILMFREIPYQYEMKLNEFLELSDLDHDKLRHSDSSFVIRQKECSSVSNSRVANYILSKPIFKSKGIGHLNFTGDFDPTSSNKINGFEFSIETLEDIKQ